MMEKISWENSKPFLVLISPSFQSKIQLSSSLNTVLRITLWFVGEQKEMTLRSPQARFYAAQNDLGNRVLKEKISLAETLSHKTSLPTKKGT